MIPSICLSYLFNIRVNFNRSILYLIDEILTSCLGVIPDRSNVTGSSSFGIAQHSKGSELPQFSEVKMFIDMILISYYTNRTVDYEIERNLMTCTPFREDYLFSKSMKTGPMRIKLSFHFQYFVTFHVFLHFSIRRKSIDDHFGHGRFYFFNSVRNVFSSF